MTDPTSPKDPVAFTVTKRSLMVAALVIGVALVAGGIGYWIGHSSHHSSTVAASATSSTTVPRTATTSRTTTTATTPATTAPATTVDRTVPPTTAVALPVLVTPQSGSVRRPSTMEMGGAHDVTITGITWSSWGLYAAQGIGSTTNSNCIPDCASGTMVTSTVEITLSQPEHGMFTLMTMTSSDSSNQSYTSTYTYPSLWPIKAY